MTRFAPLRRITHLKYGDALASEARVDGIHPVVGSGGISGSHHVGNFRAPGIIIGRKGSYGSIHWINSSGFAIDTAYFIDDTCTSANLRWLYYALHAVDLRGPSQDVGVPGLAREAVYQIMLPTEASLTRQQRVADYLDHETRRIDSLGAARSAQLSTLAERERSALDEIFRSAHSKTSTRLKYLMARRPTYGVLVPEFVDEGTPFIRVGDLLELESRATNLQSIPEALSMQYHRTIVQEGDLLVSVVGTLGKVAIAPPALRGANIARAVCSIRVQRSTDPALVAAWIESSSFRRQAAAATSTDTAQPTLGMEDLGNFHLRWPTDRDEQSRMLEAIRSKKIRFAAIKEQISRQEALVSERRQALITAAVTGQFDVSAASGRGVTE